MALRSSLSWETEGGRRLARLTPLQALDTRLKRLAENIDALAEKDQRSLNQVREITALRRRAAAELHAIAADFVASINRLLSRGEVALDPPGFAPEMFHEDGANL